MGSGSIGTRGKQLAFKVFFLISREHLLSEGPLVPTTSSLWPDVSVQPLESPTAPKPCTGGLSNL